jgi:ParB family chromosome partitioning protein
MQTIAEQNKRRGLGKGLETLLPGTRGTIQASADAGGKPREIDVELIDRNPFQTRMRFDEAQLEELTRSVAVSGVVQPILVRTGENGRFQLIAGERRWLAAKRAGKNTVPAILKQVSDEQAMEITIIENLQRADLNPIEQARAYERLSRDFKMTQEQMAARTGKERASVANFMRLLKLPVTIQDHLEVGTLSMGHAKALLALGDENVILKAGVVVVEKQMNVRQTEEFVHGMLRPVEKPKLEKDAAELEAMDPNVREAQVSLQRTLGLKVKIEDKKGKGRVVIEYGCLEDFDGLLEVLGVGK